MRRYVGGFEILSVGWVALLASGVHIISAVVVGLSGAFVIIRARPLVVYWRTRLPARTGRLWSRLSAPGRGDASYWAFLALFMWTGAILASLQGHGYPAAVGFVVGLLAWGALRLLVRRLARDSAAPDAR